MIFVLEGLPGTGKTAISRRLEKRDGFFRIGEILNEDGIEILPKESVGRSQEFFFNSDMLKYNLGKQRSEKKIIIDNEEYTLKKLKNLKLLGIKELCTKSNIDFKKKSIKSDKLINKTKDDLIKNILELDIINY